MAKTVASRCRIHKETLAGGSGDRRAIIESVTRVSNYAIALAAVAAAIVLLELIGPTVNGATAAQVLLLVLLLDARFLGALPAFVASVVAALAFARYFLTPGGLNVGDPSDWAALISFIIIAVVGGELASAAERRAAEAQAGRREIERLYQELQLAFDRASEAEAARRNEELKAALLDALTHNLRTPLTAIKAAVTAMIGSGGNDVSELSEESRGELLQVIDEESDRLNRFIEGLSTASQPGTVSPPRLRAVPLEDIVRAGLLRAETITRDHRVVIALDRELPPVWVDSASIAEAIYILVDNASKYAPAGTAITLRASRTDSRHVRLMVSDDGPGVPDAMRGRVFEKFFRIPGREPVDSRRGGAGLGLTIARRLVEAQAGRIWIEPPGVAKGTTVAIVLPAAEEPVERETYAAATRRSNVGS
jgi:K+-sensing histidine kinase KdpD